MLHLPPIPAADAAPVERPGAARALVERQLEALSRLSDLGMEMAEDAGRATRAALEAEVKPPIDPSLVYARAARAVRMCIALQARLLKDLPAIERGEARALYELRHARKKQIVHGVEQVSGTGHGDEIEQISDEAWERLREVDEYSAIMTLPLAEAVARICKDLDVTPDWSLWGGEALARETASVAEASKSLLSPSMGERSGVGVQSTAMSVASIRGAAASSA